MLFQIRNQSRFGWVRSCERIKTRHLFSSLYVHVFLYFLFTSFKSFINFHKAVS